MPKCLQEEVFNKIVIVHSIKFILTDEYFIMYIDAMFHSV